MDRQTFERFVEVANEEAQSTYDFEFVIGPVSSDDLGLYTMLAMKNYVNDDGTPLEKLAYRKVREIKDLVLPGRTIETCYLIESNYPDASPSIAISPYDLVSLFYA